jgi:predicted amidohydrolase
MPQAITELDEIRPIEEVDGFIVVERLFSTNDEHPSIGLANIHPVVPDVEGNKDKVLRAVQIFKEHKVNFAIFPEFTLSGYFWEDEEACRAYMDGAIVEEHLGWIENRLKPELDGTLRTIILNSPTRGPDGQYYNTTFEVIDAPLDYLLLPENTYHKVFLPGIERRYTQSGKDSRLVGEGPFGRVGFTTCYDYLFSELLREYVFVDKVDAIVELAAWRAFAKRDYPGLNVRSEIYYGQLWDLVMAAHSATNQVWTIACNDVGRHEISGAAFWGGSGIWAPSGMKLVQASHFNEELLIVHNLDIKGQRQVEMSEFDYAFDFNSVYRPIEGGRTFSRLG